MVGLLFNGRLRLILLQLEQHQTLTNITNNGGSHYTRALTILLVKYSLLILLYFFFQIEKVQTWAKAIGKFPFIWLYDNL